MSTSGPHSVSFVIRGPIERSDLPGLCDRVCGLLTASRSEAVTCDVDGVELDAVTVDALARLQLAARRTGCRVLLCNASDDLLELVSFMGLADILGSDEFRDRTRSYRATPRPKEGAMARMLFVNLPVKDLDATVGFFTKLGFTFDARFTDDSATAMVVNEQATVMLLVESRFRDFTTKELVDATGQTEAIMALSADSREDVDAFADKALELGASPANDPLDMGFMYGRSFNDLDGHLWEVVWMDPASVEQSQVEAGSAA